MGNNVKEKLLPLAQDSVKLTSIFLLSATALCNKTIFCSGGFVCVDRPDQDPPVECLGT